MDMGKLFMHSVIAWHKIKNHMTVLKECHGETSKLR